MGTAVDVRVMNGCIVLTACEAKAEPGEPELMKPLNCWRQSKGRYKNLLVRLAASLRVNDFSFAASCQKKGALRPFLYGRPLIPRICES